MPWQEVSKMQVREEFVALASTPGANLRQLCRRFGISPNTGYKWLKRGQAGEGLEDRSRRPKRSPGRSPEDLEAHVVALRQEHPSWGARKLRQLLLNQGVDAPAVSTVHAILLRHGCIQPEAGERCQPWQRFEHVAPNDLWQMDFKGHFPLAKGRCYPLTILDDHSRYALCLQGCSDERRETVQAHLIATFRRYGLPRRMTMDNGSPWGDTEAHYTALEVWLMRQGIRTSHSSPYHPQTQGKDERFHRTLKVELLQGRVFDDLIHAQAAFDRWRGLYNQQRPHQALDMQVPQQRYQPSPLEYQEHPPAPQYDELDLVRKVQGKGEIYCQGRPYQVGKAFIGESVAIRPTTEEGQYNVYWSTHRIARIDLREQLCIAGKRLP
ncbi:IS481 family transposase [Pseudomonas sp. A6]|uniref:IS481 family transposase n=1 Tax=Pseudomonas sp. A6 TaxID=410021 RepID=UPI004024E627